MSADIRYVCPRHEAIYTNEEHGIKYCMGCFAEARLSDVDRLLARALAEERAPWTIRAMHRQFRSQS
jgi:hypothetical protein